MVVRKDIIIDYKRFPLLVLQESHIREVEQQNQPNKSFR